ncbi:MAG: lysine decarboxylase, partial [Candidatus Latescibacterota bacterium]
MSEKEDWPPKAYKNLDFLNSAPARPLRILAEYMEPKDRFEKMGVQDTVVFFGSARILSRQKARLRLRDVEKKVGNAKRKTPRLKQEMALAEAG